MPKRRNLAKEQEAQDLYATKRYSMEDIGRMIGVSLSTVSLYVHPEKRNTKREYLKEYRERNRK